MDNYFCLKWNNHSSSFLHNLKIIHDKNLYCDATIACQGQYYPVHKFVLATCSDYFKDIFKEVVCKHPFIILKDIDPKDLEALLDYMYKGEVNVIQETILRLIEAAEALKIKGLAAHDNLYSSGSACGSTTYNRDLKRSLSPSNSISPVAFNSISHQENISKKIKTETDNHLENSKDKLPENDLPSSFPHVHSELQDESLLTKNSNSKDEEDEGNIVRSIIKNECLGNKDKVKVDLPVLPNDEDSFDDNSVNFFNAKNTSNGVDSTNMWDEFFFPESQHSIFRTNFEAQSPQCSTWNIDDSSENNGKYFDGANIKNEVMLSKKKNKADTETIGRLFSKSSLLKKLSTLSGNVYPRLQCDSCQYKCKKEISMQRHKISKHFTDKPEFIEEEQEKIQKELKCCYCSYATVQPSRLKSHMSIHTGYKPYSCTYCTYKSSQSGTMKRHIQNVHKDKFTQ